MEFVKMHGAGNDFIFIDHFHSRPETDYPALARKLCHRQLGIGADGLIVVLPSEKGDARMRIFNADGSEPEMCGNGIRCFARYIYDHGYVRKNPMNIDTLAGVLSISLQLEGETVQGVQVDMGAPIFEPTLIPVKSELNPVLRDQLQVEDQTFIFTAVSMGNPHCVIFVDDLDKLDFPRFGPAIENHPLFPRRTNVEFAQVISPTEIKVKVWERGVGPTLACGTGACATAVAGVLNGVTEKTVAVHLPGGTLKIDWKENNHIMMTGPAEYVFRGTLL